MKYAHPQHRELNMHGHAAACHTFALSAAQICLFNLYKSHLNMCKPAMVLLLAVTSESQICTPDASTHFLIHLGYDVINRKPIRGINRIKGSIESAHPVFPGASLGRGRA